MARTIDRFWGMGRPARLWLGAVLALLVVVALGWVIAGHRPPPPPVERLPSGGGPRSYAEALARLDRAVETAMRSQRAHPRDWQAAGRLAEALLSRARLTVSFGDYAAAQAMLDRALAAAPEGTAPYQSQMALDLAIDRLDRAAATADAIGRFAVVAPAMREAAALTRGDIVFYRGDYARALALYQRSGGTADDRERLLRIANHHARTGKSDEALALIDRAEGASQHPDARYLADLAMKRGTIELRRGRWTEAGHHFDRAARLLPGWWLAEAYRAQMLALGGHRRQAIAALLRVARSSASPVAMDALAALYRAAEDRDRSNFWADQARMIWNERLRQFPEATYAHAVRHILAFGDPAAALDLARRDHANRPHGATATALGWALIATGDPAGALAIIDPVLRSPWVSAESHLAAAQAHLLRGRIDQAEAEREAALRINPRATQPTAALLWFGD